jgi:hypothetical protein
MRKNNNNRLHAFRERARQQKRMEKIGKKVARRSGQGTPPTVSGG